MGSGGSPVVLVATQGAHSQSVSSTPRRLGGSAPGPPGPNSVPKPGVHGAAGQLGLVARVGPGEVFLWPDDAWKTSTYWSPDLWLCHFPCKRDKAGESPGPLQREAGGSEAGGRGREGRERPRDRGAWPRSRTGPKAVPGAGREPAQPTPASQLGEAQSLGRVRARWSVVPWGWLQRPAPVNRGSRSLASLLRVTLPAACFGSWGSALWAVPGT